MSRPAGAVYFAALVLAASGCTPNWYLLSATSNAGKQQIIAGSVDQVSAQLQATLGHLGIQATADRSGADVRLSGITRSGKKFALRLKQQDSASGQRTVIALDWQDEADEQFWMGLVDLLLLPPLPPPPDPAGVGLQPAAAPGAR